MYLQHVPVVETIVWWKSKHLVLGLVS